MAWRKTPEERAAEEAANEARLERLRQAESQRRANRAPQSQKAFDRSPIGAARAAYARGDVLHQMSLDLNPGGVASYPLGPEPDAGTADSSNEVLNAIQAEGWDLHSSGFVHAYEGRMNHGRLLGFYVFQRREKGRDAPIAAR
jgi:hypothetical protein